jgi:hypothetical protein
MSRSAIAPEAHGMSGSAAVSQACYISAQKVPSMLLKGQIQFVIPAFFWRESSHTRQFHSGAGLDSRQKHAGMTVRKPTPFFAEPYRTKEQPGESCLRRPFGPCSPAFTERGQMIIR